IQRVDLTHTLLVPGNPTTERIGPTHTRGNIRVVTTSARIRNTARAKHSATATRAGGTHRQGYRGCPACPNAHGIGRRHTEASARSEAGTPTLLRITAPALAFRVAI